jgi:hypothetical protein
MRSRQRRSVLTQWNFQATAFHAHFSPGVYSGTLREPSVLPVASPSEALLSDSAVVEAVMPNKKIRTLVGSILLVICGLITTAVPTSAGSTEKVLYSFCAVSGCADGGDPIAGLILDASGNLYGTTSQGGALAMAPSSNLRPA